jgi:hypothetical protein
LIVDLAAGTIQIDSENANAFMLVDNDGREWSLRAKSKKEAYDWITAIAINTGVNELSPMTGSMMDLRAVMEVETDAAGVDTDMMAVET